jgi:hypothetical protein
VSVFPRSAVELPRSAVGPPRFGVRHSPIEASVTSSSSSSSARPVFIAPRLISARSPPVVADPVARSPPSRFVGLDLLSADSFIGRHRGHFAPSSPTALRPAARLLLLVGDVFPPAAASLAPPPLSTLREPTATGGWVRGWTLLLEGVFFWVHAVVSLFCS